MALDSLLPTSRYVLDRWGWAGGFPGETITDINQTPDGCYGSRTPTGWYVSTLWIEACDGSQLIHRSAAGNDGNGLARENPD